MLLYKELITFLLLKWFKEESYYITCASIKDDVLITPYIAQAFLVKRAW